MRLVFYARYVNPCGEGSDGAALVSRARLAAARLEPEKATWVEKWKEPADGALAGAA